MVLNRCSDVYINKAPDASSPLLYNLELFWKGSRSPSWNTYILDNLDNMYWLACSKSPSGVILQRSVYTFVMISKRIENPPLNLWWSQIDPLIYMSIKCPWLNPNGLGPHYKPHVVLIIIIICIGSRVKVLHRASLILSVYIFGIGLTK